MDENYQACALVFSLSPLRVAASPSMPGSFQSTSFISNVQSIAAGNAVMVRSPHSSWAEVTSAAYGPGENASCPEGRLFFGSGNLILATTLSGELAALPGDVPNPWTALLNETYPPYLVSSNQMVKLKTGELLYTFAGVTWNDNITHPAWWNFTTTYPLKGRTYPGGRANIYVFRSADCGGSWFHVSDIDAATLDVPSVLPVSLQPA